MASNSFPRSKRFCTSLAAVAMALAAIFAVQPVQAATQRGDQDGPSLVVHLNADGSLVVSQGDKAAGAVVTLPSIEGLPAEIDALLPRKQERKRIAVAADDSLPYGKFMNLMNEAKESGFRGLSILGPEKEPSGESSEMVVNLGGPEFDPNNTALLAKTLFISLGSDITVNLVLGAGYDATVKHVDLADASDAAVRLAPKERAKHPVYFRADSDVPVGKALELLRKLRAIGFTKLTFVAEAPDENH